MLYGHQDFLEVHSFLCDHEGEVLSLFELFHVGTEHFSLLEIFIEVFHIKFHIIPNIVQVIFFWVLFLCIDIEFLDRRRTYDISLDLLLST